MKSISEVLGIRCARPGCKSGLKPRWTPVVSVWKGLLPDHDPARFHIDNCRVCRACSYKITPEFLISEATRAQIDTTFNKNGQPKPEWRSAKVDWKEVKNA